jgi:hypothetical protein
MRKGKRGCASFIQAQCSSSSDSSQVNILLDKLLNPLKPIDDWDTIDWIKWLIAGGRTPSEFQVIGRFLFISAVLTNRRTWGDTREFPHLHFKKLS